jgi:hypothetical protein
MYKYTIFMQRINSKKIPFFSLFIAICFFTGCSNKKMYGEIKPEFQIIRFDRDLYDYLVNNKSIDSLSENKFFLDTFGKIIHIGSPDSVGFYTRLKDYFAEPTLRRLYQYEQEKLADITGINKELASGMELLFRHFPSLKQPRIYMHVSGLSQNIVVSDSVLSLSADKYLGADYPLYQDYFYDYERHLMTPERIVPDYLLGFLMANFPFKGNNEILLDKMLYEGKLRYILSCLLPEREIQEYVAYNEEQYHWCKTHEVKIWKLILENKHLFAPDFHVSEQYIKPAPHTASLPAESPGRVGVWLGFQIVRSYMKNNSRTSWAELMEANDAKEFLKKSKY